MTKGNIQRRNREKPVELSCIESIPEAISIATSWGSSSARLVLTTLKVEEKLFDFGQLAWMN